MGHSPNSGMRRHSICGGWARSTAGTRAAWGPTRGASSPFPMPTTDAGGPSGPLGSVRRANWMTIERTLPRSARILVALVVAGGVVCLAAGVPEARGWGPEQVVQCVTLAALLAVVESFPLSMRHGTEVLFMTPSDALWMAGLLLFVAGPSPHPGVLTFAVAAGALAGQVVGRRPLVKGAFNVGQYVIAVTLAEVVFRRLAGPAAPTLPSTWIPAVAAMAACFCVNTGLTALVIALVERKSWLRTVRPSLGVSVVHWAGNMALGIVGAVVWTQVPAALPLLVVPLLLSHSAYRARLQGMLERDRMRTLYEAGRSLAGPLDRASFGPFLDLVEQLLEARSAELVVMDGDAVTIHDREGARSLTAGPSPGAQRQPQAYVPVRDGITPQVAVLGVPGEVSAVLAVYRPEELTAPERSLLDALGSQVRSRLVNERLFGEVEEQRQQVTDIIANSSDGIFVVSPDGVIESWNPAMEVMTGSRAVGRTWADVFGDDEGLGPPGPDETPRGESGRDRAGDILLVRPDGGERWIGYSRSPIRDHDGSLRGEVVVARDITAELESERLKADFVATVSHELRTPLTPLK